MLTTIATPFTAYFLGACSHLFHYLLLTHRPSTLHLSWRWLREGLLLPSATFTFAIPGMALMVYRHFDADGDDWDLHPISTLLGYVDPRRFYTFCLGQGSMASNAFYDAGVGSMDTIQHGGRGYSTLLNHWSSPGPCRSTTTITITITIINKTKEKE